MTPWTIQSMEFSRPEYWSGSPFFSPGDLPNPGIKPRSHTLQVDSLPAEPQGKPKNTGMGSLSLLQGIFLNQESNRGLALQADSLPTELSEAESESEVAQSYPTLCDPMDCSLPGFSVHGIFQARVLEWVAISFSRGSSRPRDRTQVSRTVGRRLTL